MSSNATNAEIVLNNWFLRLTGIRPNHAPSAVKRIPAGSCPLFPVDRAAQAAASPPGVPIHTPAVFPERHDPQPWAARKRAFQFT